MTATDTAARTSRKLPAGWRQAGPGRVIHDETGTEAIKTNCGWTVCVPYRPGPTCPGSAGQTLNDFFPTRAAAITAAAELVIPRTRDLIAQAWDDAHFEKVGKPHTWLQGQADEETVYARHAAVRATDTTTGYDATPGQLVIHLELGTPGAYVSRDVDADSCSYVRFAGETEEALVHSADVVVLQGHNGWLGCVVLDDDSHSEHGEAVSPECLIEDPDQDLIGPELEQAGLSRLDAADGVWVRQADNGTWMAFGPAQRASADHICCGQSRLTKTYRWINRWRAAMAERIERDHAEANEINKSTRVITIALACVQSKHYGMEINDGLGTWHRLDGVGPVDPDTGKIQVFTSGRAPVLTGNVMVELRPSGSGPSPDADPDPSMDSDYPDPDPAAPTPVRPNREPAAAGPGPAAFGFRIQTQTGHDWETVRTGTTPPIFRPDSDLLDAVADTILGNVGPVLGLGPRDPRPNARVQTWHRQSGLTGSAPKTAGNRKP